MYIIKHKKIIPLVIAICILGFVLSPLPGINAASVIINTANTALGGNTVQTLVITVLQNINNNNPAPSSTPSIPGWNNQETIPSNAVISLVIDGGTQTCNFLLGGGVSPLPTSTGCTAITSLTLNRVSDNGGSTNNYIYNYFGYGYFYSYGYAYKYGAQNVYNLIGNGTYVYGLTANVNKFGTPFVGDVSATYSINFDPTKLTSGSHTILSKVIDPSNPTNFIQSSSGTWNNTPTSGGGATVSISTPISSTTVTNPVTVTGTASGGVSSVTVSVDGLTVGTSPVISGSWSFALSTLSIGPHTVTAAATGATTVSTTFTVGGGGGGGATVAITSPTNGATGVTNPVTVSGTASGVSLVSISVDSFTVPPAPVTSGLWSLPLFPLSPGSHTVTAAATGAPTVSTTFTVSSTFGTQQTFTQPQTFGSGVVFFAPQIFNASQTFTAANTFNQLLTFNAAPTFNAAQTFGTGAIFGAPGTYNQTLTFNNVAPTFNAPQTFTAAPIFGVQGTYSQPLTFNAFPVFKAGQTFTAPPTFAAPGTFNQTMAFNVAPVFTAIPTFTAAPTFRAATNFIPETNFKVAPTFNAPQNITSTVIFQAPTTFPAGSTLNPGIIFTTTGTPILPAGVNLKGGLILPTGTTFAANLVLPKFSVIPSGVVLTGFTCPDATCAAPVANVLKPGGLLPPGTSVNNIKSAITSSVKTINATGLGLSLTFGTVTTAGQVNINVLDPNTLPSSSAGPTSSQKILTISGNPFTNVGSVMDVNLTSATIPPNTPITISLPYDPANLPAGVTENNLVLLHFTGGQWVKVSGTTVDTVNKRITGIVTSLSPFAAGASTSGGGGGRVNGGDTPGAAPSFTTGFSASEIPLSIDGTGFKLNSYSNTGTTVTLQTGKPFVLKMLLYGSQGPSDVQHVSIFTNLRDKAREIQNSDTTISWDKNQPLSISDPHHYFGPVTVSTTQNGNKLEVDWNIIFANPMATSDIVIRAWSANVRSSDVYVLDAWQVVGSNTGSPTISSTPQPIPSTPSTTQNEITQTQASSSDILSAIKDWGGYSSHTITDSEFLKDMNINDATHIPSWVSKMTKWVADDSVSPQEFQTAVSYLYQVHAIK